MSIRFARSTLSFIEFRLGAISAIKSFCAVFPIHRYLFILLYRMVCLHLSWARTDSIHFVWPCYVMYVSCTTVCVEIFLERLYLSTFWCRLYLYIHNCALQGYCRYIHKFHTGGRRYEVTVHRDEDCCCLRIMEGYWMVVCCSRLDGQLLTPSSRSKIHPLWLMRTQPESWLCKAWYKIQ